MTRVLDIMPDGRYQLRLSDEPPYCHALRMAPSEREPQLDRGLWLILVFGVWSIPDRRAIDVALAAVKKFRGKVQLGIRPMESYEEIKSWCGDVRNPFASPLWLILRDGKLAEELAGVRSEEEITDLLQRRLEGDKQARSPETGPLRPTTASDPTIMAQTSSTQGKE